MDLVVLDPSPEPFAIRETRIAHAVSPPCINFLHGAREHVEKRIQLTVERRREHQVAGLELVALLSTALVHKLVEDLQPAGMNALQPRDPARLSAREIFDHAAKLVLVAR